MPTSIRAKSIEDLTKICYRPRSSGACSKQGPSQYSPSHLYSGNLYSKTTQRDAIYFETSPEVCYAIIHRIQETRDINSQHQNSAVWWSATRKGILKLHFMLDQNSNVIKHNPHYPTTSHACIIYPGAPHMGLLFHCQTFAATLEIAYNHNGTCLPESYKLGRGSLLKIVVVLQFEYNSTHFN